MNAPSPEVIEQQLAAALMGNWEEENTSNAERRNSQRRTYSCTQSIAPCKPGERPAKKAFYQVRCRDISADGFSYFAPNKPEFEHLVVCFGSLYLEAKIAHATRKSIQGRELYVVGCVYVRRVQFPGASPGPQA